MPIAFKDEVATFTGEGTIEEAMEFADWLRDRPRAAIDLAQCTHLHASLMQCPMALRPGLAAPPIDPFLARLVAPPHLATPASTAGEAPPAGQARKRRSARTTAKARSS